MWLKRVTLLRCKKKKGGLRKMEKNMQPDEVDIKL